MNIQKIFASLFFSTFAMNAFAENCNGGEPIVQPLRIADIKVDLDKKADEIILKFLEEGSKLSADEALTKRQDRIDQVYNDYTAQRRKVYSDASCMVVSTKKCASTTGNRRQCPMSVEPPSDRTQFDVSKLVPIDDDFDVAPQLSGTAIIYTVKKNGRGHNTAGFQAPIVYKQGAINTFINRDVSLVTDYLQSRVRLGNTNTELQGQIPAANCSTLASELVHLKTLKDSGAISQADYEKLHQQKLKNCLPS